ncbi:MAG: N(5)-(carboxyethyl)ornithine synthase [Deltaproteobacteria bacterium]|nr:N(5)-(carboxyethyl)ornithine synthase [Deltaproteobacteria bacterium]
MSELVLGVVGTSRKENELRGPIHPEHFTRIPADLRPRVLFERGYADRFGGDDAQIESLFPGNLRTREELFEHCDIILLPKPTTGDFESFRDGQIIWGWPHLVQGPEITQVSIDKHLTWITWEGMHHWDGDQWRLHVFHKNNELAGYCSVLHALRLAGLTGHYGPHKKACVIGFGSVGRGAIHALQGLGILDVTLFTGRPGYGVGQPIPSVKHWRYRVVPDSTDGATEVLLDSRNVPMPEALGHFDLVINCVLQDTRAPQMFLREQELSQLRQGTIIVDVSCDANMGFSFARPTSFEEPWFGVGDRGARYYAVDHSPSYLWQASTYENSEALLPYVPAVMAGPAGWETEPTIARAVEMRNGVIVNERILEFQDREAAPPHRVRG